MALNTSFGWTVGDDIRVLIAAGLTLGGYQTRQLQSDMNYMGRTFPQAVGVVTDLLDAWDAAQVQLSEFNSASESRVLTKVDIVQWSATSPGTAYSPEREIDRIRGLLYQYFAFSPLFALESASDTTTLLRS